MKKSIGWEGNRDPFWEGEERFATASIYSSFLRGTIYSFSFDRFNVTVMHGGEKKFVDSLLQVDKKSIVASAKQFGEDGLKSQVRMTQMFGFFFFFH
jgi:hypothetical protein